MHGLLRRRRSSACLLVSSRHSRSVVLSLFTSGHEVLEDCSHLLLQLGDKAGWSRPWDLALALAKIYWLWPWPRMISNTLEIATRAVCCQKYTCRYSLLLKIHLLCASLLLLTYLSTCNISKDSLQAVVTYWQCCNMYWIWLDFKPVLAKVFTLWMFASDEWFNNCSTCVVIGSKHLLTWPWCANRSRTSSAMQLSKTRYAVYTDQLSALLSVYLSLMTLSYCQTAQFSWTSLQYYSSCW